MKSPRGVYEKVLGSGVWWIRYADTTGRIRREKAGAKSLAVQLYQKRKTEVRQAVKLPENLRTKPVPFSELANDALDFSRNHKLSHRQDACRMAFVISQFGNRTADTITPQEIDRWLESHWDWAKATKNRYLALLKLTYRLGNQNEKVKNNPARLVRMQRENNARIRYLNQHEPLPATLDYLKRHTDEESRLRAVIETKYAFHMPEFEIALNTGMRLSEQYNTEWPNVNLAQRLLTVSRSKHGEKRHIPLNSTAVAAFERLALQANGSTFVFLNMERDAPLRANKHWFENSVVEAGIRDLTWHDLRHTFASRLAMAGVDLRTIQELMGHKTIQMTCRYSHLSPSHQLAAVEKLVSHGSRLKRSKRHSTPPELTDPRTDGSN